MIFQARFPVFLECRPPGFRNLSPAVLFMDTAVDIPDVLSNDAPVVLRARSEHFKDGMVVEFDFRCVDGRFYRQSPLRLADFEASVLRTPWVRSEGLRKLVDELYLEVQPFATMKVYPPGILGILRGVQPGFNQLAFMERSGRTAIDERDMPRVDAARTRFEKACSSFIVINGNVWTECMEPLLSLNMERESPERGKISIFSGELPTRSPILGRDFPDSTLQLYPLCEFDLVRAISKELERPKHPNAGAGFALEFVDAVHFSNDFPYMQDAVRIVFELESCADVPKALADRVTTFLANDPMWVDDHVEQLLQDCLDASGPMSQVRLAIPPLLDRLRNRPISLTFETGLSPFRSPTI